MACGRRHLVLFLVAMLLAVGVAGCVDDAEPPMHQQDDPQPTASHSNTSSPVPTPTPPWYEGDYQPYPSTSTTPTPTPATREWETVLILSYVARTLEDHGGEFNGRHCADAIVAEDRIHVLDRDHERLVLDGVDHLLIVKPSIEGNWSTSGWGGFALGLPATVPSEIYNSGPWANVSWDQTNGSAFVDERAVTLPFAWNVTADDGTWRIDATLSEGPRLVETFRREGCY